MTDLFLPAPSDPPDPDFRETRHGGHALILEAAAGHAIVVEYGDCEFWVSCECGHKMAASIRPNKPLATAVLASRAHTAFTWRPLRPHCQCGAALGDAVRLGVLHEQFDGVMTAWERHSMAVGQ